MINPTHKKIATQRQCELVGLNRSSWYAQASATETTDNLDLMSLIDKLFTAHPFFGSRQIRDSLRLKGLRLNRKRIQRLMRIMGLVSVAPKPNTSQRAKGHKVYPYLLRNKVVTRPNQVWCTDITYIRLDKGFVYLVAVMDWYSRAVHGLLK